MKTVMIKSLEDRIKMLKNKEWVESHASSLEVEANNLRNPEKIAQMILDLEKQIERIKELPDEPASPLKMGSSGGCCGRAKKLPSTEAGNESPQLNNSQ